MNHRLSEARDVSRHQPPDATSLPRVLQAEEIIAAMDDSSWQALQQELAAQPDDAMLWLWNGLALEARGQWEPAGRHYAEAIERGCTHWRVGWYIARTARHLGHLELVDAACATVLKANPEFWFARELPKHARGWYSQKNQDAEIEAFFATHPPRDRVFVEVGAFDGVHYSNVRRLVESHGWSGVAIEPVQRNFEKLRRSYSGQPVLCVQAAVSNQPGEVDIHVSSYPHLPDWGSDVASLSGADRQRWTKEYQARWSTERVPARTLTSILDQAAIPSIDLLSIDAEGHDLEVLLSLDLERLRPQLIVVEYGSRRDAVTRFLQQNQYSIVTDNRQDILASDDRVTRAATTSTPSSTGSNPPITPPPQIPSFARTSVKPDLTLLNPHLLSLGILPLNQPVQRLDLPAIQLSSPERFDLPAKTLLARHTRLGVASAWAHHVYAEHIRAFTQGSFREGDGRKNNLEQYLSDFHQLLASVQQDGLDPKRSLVPVDRRQVPIDGAHRVAAALDQGTTVPCLQFDLTSQSYDWRFFLKRGLPEPVLDALALEFIRHHVNTRLFFLFPCAQGQESIVRNLLAELGPIAYEKSIHLSGEGPTLLIRELYAREKWIGSWANLFSGARRDATSRFNGTEPLRVFLLACDDTHRLRDVKTRIRTLFGLGNFSCHVNDTHEETRRLAATVFHAQSLHFLNHAQPRYLQRFAHHFELFRQWLAASGADSERFCIDGSAALAAYGLRDAQDLDVLHHGPADLHLAGPGINSHNADAHHHAISTDSILFHPEHHFYFSGIKMVTLATLRAMKARRSEGKDLQDIALIDSIANPPAPTRIPPVQTTTPSFQSEPVRIYYVPNGDDYHIADLLQKLYSTVRPFGCQNVPDYIERRILAYKTPQAPTQMWEEVRAMRPDLVYVESARNIPPELLQRIRVELGIPVTMWFGDACVDQEFIDRILSYAPAVTHQVTVDQQVALHARRRGLPNVEFIPFFGYDHYFHPTHTPKTIDILFSGKSYHRNLKRYPFAAQRLQFIQRTHRTFGSRLLVVGEHWESFDLANVRHERVPEWEINRLNNASRIVLAFDAAHVDGFTSCRTYHALLGRSFVLLRKFPGVERLFINHKHLAWFESEQEGIDLLHHYLAHPEEADAIAQAGHDHVRANQWMFSQVVRHVVRRGLGTESRTFEQVAAPYSKPLPQLLPASPIPCHTTVPTPTPTPPPSLTQRFLSLAATHESQGDIAAAQACLERALDIDPELTAALEFQKRLATLVPQPAVAPKPLPPAPTPVPAPTPTAPPTAAPQSSSPPTPLLPGQPLVSAIVSCYDADRFIRGCLQDLVDQTLFARGLLEIIVIDSGSPGKEAAVVAEFQARHPNIRYLRTERETIYAAWNRGIDMARGRYLTSANVDDRHRPQALESLAAALEAQPHLALAYADCAICEHRHPDDGYPEIRGYYRWPDFDPQLLFRACFMGPQPVWRRDLHERYGAFDASCRSAGDYEFWLRIAPTEKFIHLHEVLGLHWFSSGSLGHQNASLTRSEADAAREKHWPVRWGQRPTEPLVTLSPTPAIERLQNQVADLKSTLESLRADNTRLTNQLPATTPPTHQDHPSIASHSPDPASSDNTEGSNEVAFEALNEAFAAIKQERFDHAQDAARRFLSLVQYDALDREDRRSAESPAISVVVASCNTGLPLLQCLDSISTPDSPLHEIIVVDNGGNQAIASDLHQRSLLWVRPPINVLPSEARNIGTHFARAPIVAFVDDDALVAPGFLASILEAFQTFDIAALRGKVLPKSNHPHNVRARHYDLGDVPFPADIDTEGNSAFRRDVYLAVGGMDPLLFGGEGVELSYRISQHLGGYPTIYWPFAVILHDYAVTDSKLTAKSERHRLMREFATFKHPQLAAYHQHLVAFAASVSSRAHGRSLLRTPQPTTPSPTLTLTLPETPRISICIPSYNRAQFLPDALRSALNQSLPAFEIVVVDDGSTDDTAAVLESFHHPSLRCIRKDHSGGPDTRNRCIQEARGEFIVWLDSDDLLLPHTLERYVQELARHPFLDVLFGDLEVVDENLQQAEVWHYRDPFGFSLLPEVAIENPVPNVCSLVRKSCYERVGAYSTNFPRCHDYEFWSRLAPHGSFRHLPIPVGRYRRHENSLSRLNRRPDTHFEARVVLALIERHGLQPLFPFAYHPQRPITDGDRSARTLACLILLKYGDSTSASRLIQQTPRQTAASDPHPVNHLLSRLFGPSSKSTAPAPARGSEYNRLLNEAVAAYRAGRSDACIRASARLSQIAGEEPETLLIVALSLQRWGKDRSFETAFRCLIRSECHRALELAHHGPIPPQPQVEAIPPILAPILAELQSRLPHAPIPVGALQTTVDSLLQAGTAPDPATHLAARRAEFTPLFSAILGLDATRTDTLIEACQPLANACQSIRLTLTAASPSTRPPGTSFCIITDGRRPEKLRRQIDSIRALQFQPYEIIVGGEISHCPANVRVVDLAAAAAAGRLGKMRNALALTARYDRLVITDDDFLFQPDFAEGLRRFGEGYDVAGVRILNPDGSRFWDWATSGGLLGSALLESWENDPQTYLTGGFCLIKAHVLDRVRWDDTLGFYQGEDVDFSRRLQAAGFVLRFNPFSTVIHDDDRYTQIDRQVIRFDHLCGRLELIRHRGDPLVITKLLDHAQRLAGTDPERLSDLARLKGLLGASAQQLPTQPTRNPSPSSTPHQPTLAVAFEGSLFDFGSLSHVNRALVHALESEPDLSLALVGPRPHLNGKARFDEIAECARRLQPRPPKNTALTIRHSWPPNWSRPTQGKLAVIQPWEYGTLPKDWVRDAANVDEFWVPSAYVRQCYLDSGIPADKVHVVPNGIDPQRFHPQVTPRSLPTTKRFKFLFVGGTIPRKGPDLLLRAFLDSFTAEDDVCLVIKDFGGQSIYAGQTLAAQIAEAQRNPQAPEILHLDAEWAPDELPGLYTACNCLVHPYRGEGFGLPVLEAMACGLPVLVTAGGATDDFTTPETAYHIPAQRTPLGTRLGDLELAYPGWWLEPDPKALAQSLRWLFEHPTEARAQGLRASQHAHQHWTWSLAAQRLAQHARSLIAQPAASDRNTPTANASNAVKPAAPKSLALPDCARLGHLGPARGAFDQRRYREAWSSTLVALQQRPFHPEAFLLLAEIARATGDVPTARRCAQHARSLVPNWKPVRKFLQKLPDKSKGTTPDWMILPASLPSKSKEPSQPAPEPRLSVCLIVKNEEQFLARCLDSIRPLAHQIVVVDTGSTDRTIDIARSFGAEVHTFTWCDDFSAARNAALLHARGDWILSLDADEELPPDQHDRLRAALHQDGVLGTRLPLVNVGTEADGHAYVPRLFRNAPGLFYVSRVHEQVFPSILVRAEEWGLKTNLGDAFLRHYGYSAELVRQRGKDDRNLQLLRKAVEEIPGDANLLMNLGLELNRSGQIEEALQAYQDAFQALTHDPAQAQVPELRETLLTQFATRLLQAGRFDEVERILTSPVAGTSPLSASLHFSLGLARLRLRQPAQAAESFRQCLATRTLPTVAPVNPEIHRAGPHHALAQCLLQLGQPVLARESLQQALTVEPDALPVHLDLARLHAGQGQPVPALQSLHQLIDRGIAPAEVWHLGAEIALSHPDLHAFALDWTRESVRIHPQDDALAAQHAEALLYAGDATAALPLWRRSLESLPSPVIRAAVALCEVATETPPAAILAADESATSTAFLQWYQRLVPTSGSPLLLHVNHRLTHLDTILPTASRGLRTALAEAG